MAINYKEKSFVEQVPGLHLDWFGFSSFTTIYKLEHIFLFCRIQSYQTRGYLYTDISPYKASECSLARSSLMFCRLGTR